MVIRAFPPLTQADDDGLLAMGGDLEIESLLLAYRHGIFPWPSPGLPLLWFSPPERAILDFDRLHIPHRLQRRLRQNLFHFKIDKAFSQVIQHCAHSKTRGSQGTWILPEMQTAYQALHEAGHAHSFECYNRAGQLVGGLYGVSLGAMFAAESMFFLESDASKAALVYACEYLQSRGATWLDIQVQSPLLQSLGARNIPRSDFLKRLKAAMGQADVF